MRVIEGDNQPKPWACCDEFREAETEERIMLTETGYASVNDYDGIVGIHFDLRHCPFCGTKLPEVKG